MCAAIFAVVSAMLFASIIANIESPLLGVPVMLLWGVATVLPMMRYLDSQVERETEAPKLKVSA